MKSKESSTIAEERQERIKRLAAKGAISKEQAGELSSAIANLDNAAFSKNRVPSHRSFSAGKLALILLGSLAAMFLVILLFQTAAGNESAVVSSVQDVSQSLNAPNATGQLGGVWQAAFSSTLLFFLPLSLLILLATFSYNKLANTEEAVEAAWAQVESSYQQRTDLFPKLVEICRELLGAEKETQLGVTESRGQKSPLASLAREMEESAKDISVLREGLEVEAEATIGRAVLAAEEHLSKGLSSFKATAENYPNLLSSQNYLQLQVQLEDIERQIFYARSAFNDAVGAYNKASKTLPHSLLAKCGGFVSREYYTSAPVQAYASQTSSENE